MSTLLADTPIIECIVRREMLYNQRRVPNKQDVPGYIFGFTGRTGHAPAFQVMTQDGAQWARVPLHMLYWKRGCGIVALGDLCWWDCFSDVFTVHVFNFLQGQPCKLLSRSGKEYTGNYLFTVDWQGRWAEIPDQHKQHHFIRLSSGHFAMYPNNKVVWYDSSWIKPLDSKPDWLVNTHAWAVEGSPQGALPNTEAFDYGQRPEKRK